MHPDERPLLVTLALDEATFARLDAERRAYMPPAQNRVPAHCMLFHALPQAKRTAIEAALAGAARRAPIALVVDGLRSLGRGVAYTIAAPDLLAVRRMLATAWRDDLIPQDRESYRPHVVVQNKTSPAEARRTFERLEAAFAPFAATGEALELWRYDGGPWTHVARFAFAD